MIKILTPLNESLIQRTVIKISAGFYIPNLTWEYKGSNIARQLKKNEYEGLKTSRSKYS